MIEWLSSWQDLIPFLQSWYSKAQKFSTKEYSVNAIFLYNELLNLDETLQISYLDNSKAKFILEKLISLFKYVFLS